MEQMPRIACCACVKDRETELGHILRNLNCLHGALRSNHWQVTFVFVLDRSQDRTEDVLDRYAATHPHMRVIKLESNDSPLRSVRIANARNAALDYCEQKLPDLDYFAMIDINDRNIPQWNVRLILDCLKRTDWDMLWFSKTYLRNDCNYDIWALSMADHPVDCWAFGDDSLAVIQHMRQQLRDKLKDAETDFIPCVSAFNGFGLYRAKCVAGLRYSGLVAEVEKLMGPDWDAAGRRVLAKEIGRALATKSTDRVGICEHMHYHLAALKHKKARGFICKHSLFQQP